VLPTITVDIPDFISIRLAQHGLLGLVTDTWLHDVGKGDGPRALVNPHPGLKTRTPEFDAALLELKVEVGTGKSGATRQAAGGLRSPAQCQQRRGNQQEPAECQPHPSLGQAAGELDASGDRRDPTKRKR
jgi:hypothetical protein